MSSVEKYHKSIITLHWLIAIIVFILIGLGLNMIDIERGTPQRAFYYNPHGNRLTVNLNGTADHATEIQSTLASTGSNTYYLQMSGGTGTGQKTLYFDTALSFNPSTNALTIPTIISSTAGPTTEYSLSIVG